MPNSIKSLAANVCVSDYPSRIVPYAHPCWYHFSMSKPAVQRRKAQDRRMKRAKCCIKNRNAHILRWCRQTLGKRGMRQAYALGIVGGVLIFGAIAAHENDARPHERVDRDTRATRGRSRRASMSSRSSKLEISSGPEMSVRHISAKSQHTNHSTQTPASAPETSSSFPSVQS
jgi:hypothetical protein